MTMKQDQADFLKGPVLSADRLSKSFGPLKALDEVSFQIEGGSIFGLIGTNGAGKSTFLRLAAGVYKPQSGRILYRGRPIFENPPAKQNIQFVSDQPYFYYDRLKQMAAFYRSLYLHWDQDLYQDLLALFPVREDDRLDRMSRGMQRQAALILAMAAKPDLLLMDEAFDGLDPVMRQNLKKALARQVADREMTVLIASQNLQELEDFCDHVGLLHQGDLLFVEELDKLRLGTVKVQAAFQQAVSREDLSGLGLDILQFKHRGSLVEFLARSQEDLVLQALKAKAPLFVDILPLSLEEVFIYELSLKAYQVSDLLP